MKHSIHHSGAKSRQLLACLTVALIAGFGTGSLLAAQDTVNTTPPTSSDPANNAYKNDNAANPNYNTADTTSTTTRTTADGKIAHQDKHFIAKASMASNNEVALSQLAADHASSAAVKSFAQEMIMAHQQLNNDLQSLASQKDVDITKAIEKGQKDDVDSLAKKSGADFDKAYMKKMVHGHEEASELFAKEAKSGKDADAIALANKYLSIINDHWQHAKTLKQSVENM